MITKKAHEPGNDFFYKYKKISISSNNIYKLNKDIDQIREDKAVQIYFQKQAQTAKEMKRLLDKEREMNKFMAKRKEEEIRSKNQDPEEHMHEIIYMIADEQAVVQEAKDLNEAKDFIRRKQVKAEKVIKVYERDLATIIKTFNLSNAKVRNVFKQNLNILKQHPKIKKLRLKRN